MPEKLSRRFYSAVYRNDVSMVQELLEKGVNPDYCHGEIGWIDSNPLDVLSRNFYTTYYRPQDIPDLDVKLFYLLIDAGADINKRPYIWGRVYLYNNNLIHGTINQRRIDMESDNDEDIRNQIDWFINDANRLLKVFLEAGADPDKLGHPYPYSYDAINEKLTDEQVNEYFSKGTRAINVAIEKGILWETQVDLLLRYTNLDEESLLAAERSGDPAMIEKIKTLYNELRLSSTLNSVGYRTFDSHAKSLKNRKRCFSA
jgi:hypothetical protein